MNYNLEALRKLKAWDEDPGDDVFDYMFYVSETECGTTLCYGGKLIMDAGAEPIWERPLTPPYDRRFAAYCLWRDRKRHIENVAAELAGLNAPEADTLFSVDLGSREEEAACARDFLGVLVRRAEAGIRNMTEEEVDAWKTAWIDDEEGYREQR